MQYVSVRVVWLFLFIASYNCYLSRHKAAVHDRCVASTDMVSRAPVRSNSSRYKAFKQVIWSKQLSQTAKKSGRTSDESQSALRASSTSKRHMKSFKVLVTNIVSHYIRVIVMHIQLYQKWANVLV